MWLKTDLGHLVLMSAVVPDPLGFWTYVKSKTPDGDMQDVCNFVINGGGVSAGWDRLDRLIASVQELQAITQELRLNVTEFHGENQTELSAELVSGLPS